MASISTTTSAAVQATTPRAWLVPGAMIAGIGGPLVLAVCNTLVNFTPDWRRAESTADGVNATIAHPVLAEFIIGTGIVAVLLIVPGIWAVAARLAPRTPVLAAIGGWMMATGYICALVLSTSSLTEQKIALSGLDPESFGKAFDAQWPMGQIMIGAIFGFGALCGGIVLGIAILRQRGGMPKWAGWLLLAAEPVRMAGLRLGIPVGPPLASLLILAAFAGVLFAWPGVATAAAEPA